MRLVPSGRGKPSGSAAPSSVVVTAAGPFAGAGASFAATRTVGQRVSNTRSGTIAFKAVRPFRNAPLIGNSNFQDGSSNHSGLTGLEFKRKGAGRRGSESKGERAVIGGQKLDDRPYHFMPCPGFVEASAFRQDHGPAVFQRSPASSSSRWPSVGGACLGATWMRQRSKVRFDGERARFFMPEIGLCTPLARCVNAISLLPTTFHETPD